MILNATFKLPSIQAIRFGRQALAGTLFCKTFATQNEQRFQEYHQFCAVPLSSCGA
jgi:hypothetical protein